MKTIYILNDGRKVVLSRGHTMPVGIAKFDDGSLVISCLGGTVERIAPDGSVTILSRDLGSPAPGLMRDGDDAVLVVDYGGTRLARVTLNGETTTILIRLIRSDGKLNVFGELFHVDPDLRYEYVWATINVAKQRLYLMHDGEQVDDWEYITT